MVIGDFCYEVKMRHEKNSNTKVILAIAAGLLIAGGIYVTNRAGWLTTENGRSNGVRDDGVSVQQVKEQFSGAEKNQHSITDGVTAVEGRVESIQQQTADVAESTERAEQRLSDAESQNERAGELIAECESILGSVRKRVQPKAKTN